MADKTKADLIHENNKLKIRNVQFTATRSQMSHSLTLLRNENSKLLSKNTQLVLDNRELAKDMNAQFIDKNRTVTNLNDLIDEKENDVKCLSKAIKLLIEELSTQ